MNLFDPTIQRIFWGTLFIAIAGSATGVFTYLRKKTLIGDAISHAILPGIALAYITVQTKNTAVLLLGALIAGWLATQSIALLERTTKLKTDSIIAIVLSAFFSVGLVLMSWIQGHGTASQSGLSDFLFGKIVAISSEDVLLFGCICAFLVLLIVWKFRLFYLAAFNPDFMQIRGFSMRWNELLLSSTTILAIAMGIQAVGVVLMSAVLIIPVATARMMTFKMVPLLLISISIGIVGSLTGAWISTQAPNIPTGPSIIVVLFSITSITLFIRFLKTRRNRL